MKGKTRLQNVRSGIESFVDGVKGKMSRRNAIIAAQDFLEDGPRTGFEFSKPRGALNCLPTFPLAVARLWRSRANSDKKHAAV